MSRPNVFRRIASWLKNTAKLNENRAKLKAEERLQRLYSVQVLEDRHMLDASFTFDAVGDRLIMDNFSEVFGEAVTISETANDFRFLLSEGTWAGTNNALAGISGAGTSDLRINKDPLGPGTPMAIDQVEIDDDIGIDIIFDNADFTNIDHFVDNFIIDTNRGHISQTALSDVQFINFIVDGADLIELREINNQFQLITVRDSNDVFMRDAAAMDLGRIEVNNDAEFENNGLMILHTTFEIGGNVLLNANDGDIFQQRDAAVFVGGETFLKSNTAGEFGIDLGFGDRNGDGLNDNDFVGAVNVLQGASVEIVDVNNLIIGDVNMHGNRDPELFQFYAESQTGSVTVDGIIDNQGTDNADGKVIIRAANGATETPQGLIRTDNFVVIGTGDFIFDRANEVFDLNNGRPGIIIGDVTGNLLFHNELDLQVARDSFEFAPERAPDGSPLPPVVVDVNALKVRKLPDGTAGNLTITINNNNLTQNGTAPVIVEDLTTIDTGTGNVIWDFGDELGDLLNDNDWHRITVLNAATASFVDENTMIVENVTATNNARFEAENDNVITLDGEILVTNLVLFQSDIGVIQQSGFIDAAGLMAQGTGDFIFDLTNRIGDAGTIGRVAAELRSGEFVVENLFGIQVTTLAAFGENIVGIDGFQVDKTRLRGAEVQVNQVVNVLDVFLESETTISQTSAITADSLMVRSNEDTNLNVPNSVGIVAADVEGGFTFSNDIELFIGELTYDGTTITGVTVQNGVDNDFNIITSDDDVHQTADAPVIVDGIMTIDIGLGCLDFVFGDDDADTINDNDFNVIVINSALRAEIVDRNDMTTNAINVGEQIRLKSEIGTINLEGDLTATNIVLLEAGNGVQQNPDAGGGLGVINTAALMLKGDGAFILDHDNEVGDATTKGEIAVEINGGFELNNLFELVSKKLEFTLKDGSKVIINGFTINSGGDALVLNVNGLTIETPIAAPKIIINTNGDIIQSPTGQLITDELVLTGVGNFELIAPNEIGTAGTPGVVAIDVEGNVELANIFALNFGEIICGPDTFFGATLTLGAFSAGDLTLRTADMDITQTDESIFTVAGETTFDVGAGNVNLHGFLLNQNDFNVIKVDSGNVVEIADANNITIESSTVTDTMQIQAGSTVPSRIILDDNITVGNQLLLQAELGVSQTRGFITADTLLLDGASDFDLRLANEVNNLGAMITGNLEFTNHLDLTFVKDDYVDLNGTTTSFAGVELDPALFDGNLTITTSNDNVTQAADAHVKVAESALFDLGSGNLELLFGDSNADLLNDNDINVLAVASAANAEVVDQNSISLDNSNVGNNLFVKSEGGSISIQGNVAADDSILLDALTGAGTTIGASLDTDNLLITGKGEFNLNGTNLIGSAAVPGNVAIDVIGDVILHNEFGVHFDDLTFTMLSGPVINIAGVNVDSNGFAGNLFVNAGGGVTDSDTVDVMVDGHAAFVASAGADVDLGGVNQLMAESVGLGGRNVTIIMDNELILDGVNVSGDLLVESKGGITQSAIDESGMAGSRFVNVDGTATFIVDSISGLVEELNVNLLSANGDLMNNRFGGQIVIEGTSFSAAGFGQLGSVQVRNATLDNALFPTINRLGGDQLTSLSVWAPNSSLTVKNLGAGTDYDVINNISIFAGVDSETGQVGGKLKVTDNTKNRSLRDDAGVEFVIGGNFNANAANTLTLADEGDNSLIVGGTLSLVNQGGSAENRIRVGVGAAGNRGTDSGATVTADSLRTRARRTGTDGHVTVNLDSDVNFTNSNFATSLVVVSGGDIVDEANASISVANSAFFEANNGAGDVTLGDDNLSNRTIFGSVGFKANDVTMTEDTSTLLNGLDVAGNLDVFSAGSIRQSGFDRQGRAGTDFIEVAGNSVFTVDGNNIPSNHLQDSSGRDVLLMNNGSQDLMDNLFAGNITIQSTQATSGGTGTVRSVAIRNTALNVAATPQFNVDATDQLKHLTIWHPNASVLLNNQTNAVDYDIAGRLMVIAGLDSDNGKVSGTKSIVNDLVSRNINDQANVSISVGLNASFYTSNRITLVDDSTNSLTVGKTTNLVSKGGLQGNRIDVGTAGARGDDSGGVFETSRLKFTIEDTGIGGDLTVVADQAFLLDPTSSAPSVVLKP